MTLDVGYTISRAILSDAIALTRGDRHFTHDYTPHNLTAAGFRFLSIFFIPTYLTRAVPYLETANVVRPF
jgi:hypothetical protein